MTNIVSDLEIYETYFKDGNCFKTFELYLEKKPKHKYNKNGSEVILTYLNDDFNLSTWDKQNHCAVIHWIFCGNFYNITTCVHELSKIRGIEPYSMIKGIYTKIIYYYYENIKPKLIV
jgi:hypothetical protein